MGLVDQSVAHAERQQLGEQPAHVVLGNECVTVLRDCRGGLRFEEAAERVDGDALFFGGRKIHGETVLQCSIKLMKLSQSAFL